MSKPMHHRTRETVRWIAVIVLILGAGVGAQNSPPPRQEVLSVVEVSGQVTDTSHAPMENVIIKALGTDVSPVLSDAKGMYKFYLVNQTAAFTLAASKEGYSSDPSPPVEPRRQVRFDPVLTSTRERVSVTMGNFVSGVSISGRVTGLEAKDVGRYKVVLYVLTNRWYIHPIAENMEGTGYAPITTDGSWTMRTVNRSNHPFRLAILVLPMDHVPPAVVESGEDAESSLRARFGTNLIASQILPGPEGL